MISTNTQQTNPLSLKVIFIEQSIIHANGAADA
jgi:hypothetical protein